MALLAVLVILLGVSASSASFIWFMNQQQSRAGEFYRRAAAMAVAEAGVHRALSILESDAPNSGSRGRAWRATQYTEHVPVGPRDGRFTLSLIDDDDGAVVITSVGEVGGLARRIRGRVYLSTPALLAALYARGLVELEDSAKVFIHGYGEGLGTRPWIHISAGKGIVFAAPGVVINPPDSTLVPAPGPVDRPIPRNARALDLDPFRVLLPRGAPVLVGQEQLPVNAHHHRVFGADMRVMFMHSERLSSPPEVNRDFYLARAAANTANASLNHAAGRYLGDSDLADKRDSVYSPVQFARLRTYLHSGPASSWLQGVIYVAGDLLISEGGHVRIVDGSLIVEGSIEIGGDNAIVEIAHSASTRNLPGLIVLGDGELLVAGEGRLQVHGLVYASGTVDVVDGARVDIVGSIVANEPDFSFINTSATILIQYDPAVLGTPGLRVRNDTPVVAWVAEWSELP